MNRVRNCTDRGIEVLGWRFLPKSTYAISPGGQKTDHIPAVVAFSQQAKRLADLMLLEIDGYTPAAPKSVPVQPPAAPVQIVEVELPPVPAFVVIDMGDSLEDETEEGSEEPVDGGTVEPGRKRRKRR